LRVYDSPLNLKFGFPKVIQFAKLLWLTNYFHAILTFAEIITLFLQNKRLLMFEKVGRNSALILIILSMFPAFMVSGQLNSGGMPGSTIYSLPPYAGEVIRLKAPDMDRINRFDEKYASPYRFAVILPVDISPDKSGTWDLMPDGSRIWRVSVTVPGAKALGAYFDKFILPEGGKVFLYDPSKNQIIGAFTSLNNVPGGFFATELITGDQFILEYFQPSGLSTVPLIHMYNIDFAYRGVGFLDNYSHTEQPETDCEVNVVCSEGDNWRNQIKGEVRIKLRKDSNTFWCSGSVMNNVRADRTPYVLTADHCFEGATAHDIQQWIFYFGFDSPTCITAVPSTTKSITGATLKSHGGNSGDTGSDFCLVMLNQAIPDTFQVFYNGWSRVDTTSPSGVTIHHPGGSVKKISTYQQSLLTTAYPGTALLCFWQVIWAATTDGHGVTEPGSSGAPLFDNKGRVVGTLTGGDSSCDSGSLDSPDYYGKFSWSWDKNGSDSTSQLKHWLDPDNSGVLLLNGMTLGLPSLTKQFAGSPKSFY
jgi:hypothetical protein